MNKIEFNNDDLYEIAAEEADVLGIDMYLDLIFSKELSTYFNFNYNQYEDTVVYNFEVDEGGASLKISNLSWDPQVYLNDVLVEHIECREHERL